jgi:uncharacterized protein (DUF2267 family)
MTRTFWESLADEHAADLRITLHHEFREWLHEAQERDIPRCGPGDDTCPLTPYATEFVERVMDKLGVA